MLHVPREIVPIPVKVVYDIFEFGFDNWFLDDLRQRNVDGMKGGFTLNQINPVLTVIFVSISYRSQIKLSLRL